MKKIKHKTKMRRRIMNHSVYSNSKYWSVEDSGYGYSIYKITHYGKTKGSQLGNLNTGL